MSEQRAKAVILLQRESQRLEARLLGVSEEALKEAGPKGGSDLLATAAKEWARLIELIKTDAEGEGSTASLAAARGCSPEALLEGLALANEHFTRSAYTQKMENRVQSVVDGHVKRGVPSGFKEPSSDASAESYKRAHESYFPRLFGDEGAKEAIEDLKRRVNAETRAQLKQSAPDLLEQLTEGPPVPPVLPAPLPNAGNVPAPALSRWKWAFRDTSKASRGPQGNVVTPTHVRTRGSKWRQATVLEELSRSWHPKPLPSDMALFEEQLQRWVDPDGDEEAAAQLSTLKLQRRKELKADRAAAAE
jgi:hypothetical protein